MVITNGPDSTVPIPLDFDTNDEIKIVSTASPDGNKPRPPQLNRLERRRQKATKEMRNARRR